MKLAIRMPKPGSFPLLLMAAIGMAPIYVFPSGLPQPGDFLMVLWIGAVFFALQKDRAGVVLSDKSKLATLTFLALVLWVWIVNLTHALILQDSWIAFQPLFYTFNFLVFLAFVIRAATDAQGFRRLLLQCFTVCAAILLFLLITGYDTERARQIGGFNNPNQLGYFSILLFACYVVIAEKREILSLPGLLIAVSCIFGVMGSLSFGASAGLLAVLLGAAIKVLKGSPIKNLIQLGLGVAALISVFVFALRDFLSTRWEAAVFRSARFERKLNEEGFRGHDRILDHDHYLIFGAGEQGLWRYDSTIELHSSFGTIIFSYGVVGVFIALALVIAVFRRSPFPIFVVAAGPALYQISHQGLRTTFLWIFLALVLTYGRSSERRAARRPWSFRRRFRPAFKTYPHGAGD